VTPFGIAVLVACGAPPPARLGPAGSRWDDGTGQLASASVKLRVEGSGDDDPDGRDERYERRRVEVRSGRGYGGMGYGGFGYGGAGYGGYGAFAGIGYGPPPPQPPTYNQTAVVDAGAVEGHVRWKSGGGVAWPEGCAAARVAHGGAAVGGAVVYLDGVRAGRTIPYAMALVKTGGVAEVTDCAIVPAVQLAGPLPVPLLIENRDRKPARVHHERPGGVTTVELDPGGRASFALERPGASQLRDGVRAPAWVIAQAHPYYTITGDDGRFVLDEVPPGNHELVIWYPPLVSSSGPDGPRWSGPTVERRKLTVGKGALATVDAEITPSR
jgi:hypothetical protein